jgi:hypothetical protein
MLCAAALLAYGATRLVAFPLLADDVGAWFEPLGIVSVIAEAGVVMTVYAAISPEPKPDPAITSGRRFVLAVAGLSPSGTSSDGRSPA